MSNFTHTISILIQTFKFNIVSASSTELNHTLHLHSITSKIYECQILIFHRLNYEQNPLHSTTNYQHQNSITSSTTIQIRSTIDNNAQLRAISPKSNSGQSSCYGSITSNEVTSIEKQFRFSFNRT